MRICVSCKYASEPQGFKHVSGSEEWDRQFEFEDIFARSIDQKRTIEVLPPPGVNRFEIDIICACETCIVGGKETLWVNVR